MKMMENIIFLYLLCINYVQTKVARKVTCAVHVAQWSTVYCLQQFVFVTNVAIRPFVRLGVGGKTVLRRALNRNNSGSFECHKMIFQTIIKMVIDPSIHQTSGNYLQAMGSYVLKSEGTSSCKELLSERLQFG